MNFLKFSNDKDVLNFVSWIDSKLDKKGSFDYSYITKRPKIELKFDSIFCAYEKYIWKNKTFSDNQVLLNDCSKKIKAGLRSGDKNLVRQNCENILIWGGVKKGNIKRINEIDDIIFYLKNVINLIDLASCEDESNDYSKVYCNAGFSKIYSTIIEDFIIYDSRVSSALCLFIRLFAEKNGLTKIPKNLNFAFTKGNKGKSPINYRSPNKGCYLFEELSPNKHLKYLKNNIIASWLLKLIINKTNSKFNELSKDIQIRALESALFMIGYQIKI